MSTAHVGWVLLLLLVVVGRAHAQDVPDGPAAGNAPEWTAARQELDKQFASQLEALARRCEEQGLADAARFTRGWQIRRAAGRLYVFLPQPTAPDPIGEPGSLARQWSDQFLDLRRAHAEQLFQLARQTARKRPDWAYQLAHEVLHEDPEHELARQALGYRRVADRWVYAGDEIKSSLGTGVLKDYGFAARQYHRIDSANFRILTNADEQTGRELARRLEELHCVWRQLFFEFWGSGALLAQRLDRGAPDARARVEKHRVVWFQNREQYVAALRDDQPLIEKTLGIYLDKHRTAFLYGDPQQTLTTWLHEVTHQLFAGHARTRSEVGGEGHIWIVEGIALFMESVWWHGDYCTVGGFDADRLQFARYRYLNDQFYIPLVELTAMDRATVQNHPQIGAIYSQSAGLAHYLMTEQEGELRPALIQYLTMIYRGRATSAALPQLTKLGYAELDQRYQTSLNVTDDDVQHCVPVTNLYLGHSAITDAGLTAIPVQNLRWLDVGFTSISDGGLARLQAATQLQKLTLEHTRITSAGLAQLAGLKKLEYLDLAGLPIDDAALSKLATFTNLQALWLTDTLITDDGLAHLAGLKTLKTLDVSGTHVTAAGLSRLRQTLPDLQLVPDLQ